jgi:hypothetical protein
MEAGREAAAMASGSETTSAPYSGPSPHHARTTPAPRFHQRITSTEPSKRGLSRRFSRRAWCSKPSFFAGFSRGMCQKPDKTHKNQKKPVETGVF